MGEERGNTSVDADSLVDWVAPGTLDSMAEAAGKGKATHTKKGSTTAVACAQACEPHEKGCKVPQAQASMLSL